MSDGRRWLTASTLTAATLPVAAACAAVRAVAARGNASPAVRESAIATAATAVAIAVIPPATVDRLSAWTREPATAPLIAQLATATAASYGTAVLQRGLYPEPVAIAKVRLWRLYLRLTASAMVALFLWDRSTVSELREPTDRLFKSKVSACYWLAFAGHMAATAGEIASLGRKSSKSPGATGSTLAGVRMMRIGGTTMSCLYAQLVVGTVGRRVWRHAPRPFRGMPVLAGVTASGIVIASGASLAGVVLRAGRLRQMLSDSVVFLRLRPCWQLLVATDATQHAPIAGGIGLADVRLHRRVIEMLDALDRLSATHDPLSQAGVHAAQVADGTDLTAEDQLAVARAALIVCGLARPGTDEDAEAAPVAESEADFRREACQLLTAGRYVKTSTLPAAVAAALTNRTGERF